MIALHMIDVGVGGGGRRSGLIGHSLMVTCRPSWLRGDSLARTMRPGSSNQSFVRGIRRSVGWKAFKEYVGGALWVMPSIAALIALAAGYGLSQIDVPPGSRLDWLAFQGTADDARALLISISSTVVTVIALVLGLTVVALQLSSTQFSPRLLRNFLRDRPTQVVLSGFLATFVYSAGGLFTVGLEAGTRTEVYPRFAVSVAILLLFVSLGMVIYFADHLAHSIQIDAINRKVERNTRRAIAEEDIATVEEAAPRIPEWALPLLSRKSGYIQTVHPQLLLPLVNEADVTICLRKRVGEHVVEGTVLAWVWAPSPDVPLPADETFETAVAADVRIGFERTIEQDVAFGIRQQIDIGCKALSPAVNDPYTAAQAIDHLAVVCADLAVRPLGNKVLTGPSGSGRVIVPGNNFADYIFFIGGLFGRYGSSDLVVMLALIRLYETCVEVLPPGSHRLAVLDHAAVEALDDAERSMPRPPSVERMRAAVKALRIKIKSATS
jgi:uncharacterized membrane protein